MRLFSLCAAMAGAMTLAMLGGCVSFGAKPPPRLLSLSATADAEPAPDAKARTIAVFEPDTPRKLATLRVPVQVDDTAIAYVKDAQWVDTPRRMFARLLATHMATDARMLPLDPAQGQVGDAPRLTGTLAEFGVDARTGEAVVRYEATLAGSNGALLARRIFVAREKVGKIGPKTVAGPIDRAAHQVAGDVAAWVAATP